MYIRLQKSLFNHELVNEYYQFLWIVSYKKFLQVFINFNYTRLFLTMKCFESVQCFHSKYSLS